MSGLPGGRGVSGQRVGWLFPAVCLRTGDVSATSESHDMSSMSGGLLLSDTDEQHGVPGRHVSANDERDIVKCLSFVSDVHVLLLGRHVGADGLRDDWNDGKYGVHGLDRQHGQHGIHWDDGVERFDGQHGVHG